MRWYVQIPAHDTIYTVNITQEHIVQWHPTILSKLALIPQRKLNSYNIADNEASAYKSGDFVIHFKGCETGGSRSCEAEAEVYSKQWRTVFNTR